MATNPQSKQLDQFKVDLLTPRPDPTNPMITRKGDSPITAFTKINDLLDYLYPSIEIISPTEPVEPVANMKWLDTSGTMPVLKRRSSDNTKWIVMETIDGGGSVFEGNFQLRGEIPDPVSLDTLNTREHVGIWFMSDPAKSIVEAGFPADNLGAGYAVVVPTVNGVTQLWFTAETGRKSSRGMSDTQEFSAWNTDLIKSDVTTIIDGLGTASTKDVGTAADQIPLNSDLGSASTKDVGTAAEQIPQNKHLGSASKLNTGTAAGQVPKNSDLGSGAKRDVVTGKPDQTAGRLITTDWVGSVAQRDTGSAANQVPLNSNLGSAAFKSVVANHTDTTAGRVTDVGWMGLGSIDNPTINLRDQNQPAGFYAGRGAQEPGANVPWGGSGFYGSAIVARRGTASNGFNAFLMDGIYAGHVNYNFNESLWQMVEYLTTANCPVAANSNGLSFRLLNGLQICINTGVTVSTNQYAFYSWTFPQYFASGHIPFAIGQTNSKLDSDYTSHIVKLDPPGGVDNTVAGFRVTRHGTGATGTVQGVTSQQIIFYGLAIGRWKNL